MAKKSTKKFNNPNVVGLKGEVREEAISQTLETNYMPYAMSVIVSRAIPEIDGFKPSHRKLLYTMYKMGLLKGTRTKSANIVGQTMRLNPHGDAAIYETMIRLSIGNESLLVPFVDSKGNFGKVYSRDMSYAASRYTEAKLAPICEELFSEIDKDTVDFVDNYDGTMKEPTLLPTRFPNILVSSNLGIAVGLASQICGFNLNEVCETTIKCLFDPEHDILSTLTAPDFPTGGELIYNRSELEDIYRTGKGSFKVRAKWRLSADSSQIIEIYEIPYTTSTDIIIDKVAELVKQGKIKEINDIRDETDLGGLKIAIDMKRGTDADKLMQKLYRYTTLEDSFSCNFNILVGGFPKLMGIREIINEWIAWRSECVRRRVYKECEDKKAKLHLLKGLEKVLLDIDKAIAIIRETEYESEVIPNLMASFGIDAVQAEYVAEIKLRNINREYILNRTKDISTLTDDIEDLESILESRIKIKHIIEQELKAINIKFVTPRKTSIILDEEVRRFDEETDIPDYPVTVFLSNEGYFKKFTASALRSSGEQKYKEGDGLNISFETSNKSELIFITNKQQAYKARINDFTDTGKASTLGLFLPTALNFDEGETILYMLDPEDFSADLLIMFDNGKAARVSLKSFETKTNRKKLINAYSDNAAPIAFYKLKGEIELVCSSEDGRTLVFNTALLQTKTTRNTAGVAVMNLKKNCKMVSAVTTDNSVITNISRYKLKSIPGAGAIIKNEDQIEQQLSLIPETD